MTTTVGVSFYFGWELHLIEWLQAHLPAWAISLISMCSFFGEEIFVILLLGFLYWGLDKKLGRQIGLTVLLSNGWNVTLKNIFVRRRPYFDSERISLLRIVNRDAAVDDLIGQGYSFPSGHSTCVVSVFGSLATYIKKRSAVILAIVLTLLVGFSRMTVGAHYPTDVLAGYLSGLVALAWVYLAAHLAERAGKPVLLYVLILVAILPGLITCRSETYFTTLGMFLGFSAGSLFDDKYVQFQNTKIPLFLVLRPVGGLAIYFALNTLLKLPFSATFLDSGTMVALLVRCARYAVICFIDFGLYPMLFARIESRWKPAEHRA